MNATGPATTTESITMYSDYVCPFCYLGRESLRRYQETRETPLEIDWHPFDLRGQQRGENGEIDHSVETGKDDAYYEQARENVARLKEQYDVVMNQDLVGDVDSFDAQLVSWRVKDEFSYEDWLAFDEAILDALWTEGRDIGDRTVLVDLADEVGIETTVVERALDEEDRREELSKQFETATQAGITGVPTFAYEGHAARGAVPPEQLERLVEGAQ